MFQHFFHELRAAKVPVTLKEYLTLLEAMDKGVVGGDGGNEVQDFYYLSRAALVKDEKHLDRFDKVFGHVFKGLDSFSEGVDVHQFPEEWLKKMSEKFLSEEDKKMIEAMGGWEKLMETLKERMAEQKKRHEGGNKMIGTAGTSPYGAHGYNPEGVRIGQDKSRHQRAVKVWDKREFKNLDDSVEIGTRNLKVALRRLRKWARDGAADELDLDGTIRSTAKQGYIDIVMRPERRNAVKLLMFLDIGGSMDPHVKACEELFSAARTEFKNLEFFYFHNCIYEGVWKDNRRRHAEKIPTWDLLHKYNGDWRAIFVGDATMSPYEVTMPGGSVEHWNEEAGATWMRRARLQWDKSVWLNPVAERYWSYTASVKLLAEVMDERMYPLTLDGLDRAMRALTR